MPKAGRTEVRSREVSSGCGTRTGVRCERGSEIRAASPDQPCQTLPPETQDRKMKDKIETQANRRRDTRHEHQTWPLTMSMLLSQPDLWGLGARITVADLVLGLSGSLFCFLTGSSVLSEFQKEVALSHFLQDYSKCSVAIASEMAPGDPHFLVFIPV